MTTDTAHLHWNAEWASLPDDSKWRVAEPDVLRWAGTLQRGARILDLGAGVGRHTVPLADDGFAVTALDAAPEALSAIKSAAPRVETVKAPMDALPFSDGAFDHVLAWNVIYHGDEAVLTRTIGEIVRVLKPGGTFLCTMLSKRRLPSEWAAAPGREISRNTFVFDTDQSDKRHPHYYCDGRELLSLFSAFEILRLEDREHDSPGSWHWHALWERQP